MSQVWFVTGSSRGLGRSIVEKALEAGNRVVATARKPEDLADLTEKYGDRVLLLALDVADADAAESAVQAAVGTFGRIDVVVNNAGYGDTASIEDMSTEMFRAQIDTNFYGVVNVTKAALPYLREQGSGYFFQISSLGGRLGTPGLSAYQSAKWAVGGFSEVLANEVGPLGIKVTVVEPGGMRTDWAGSSMTIPEVSAPYEQTVGMLAQMIREANGAEPSDPDKVAQLLVDLSTKDEVPVRLLIGTDAVEYAANAAQVRAQSDEQWRGLSESVSFDIKVP
ncbi:MAG: short-chain alcohol dehydrogenase [Marmoricola sp.]|nr:short-chain alcohol dehydrogenase [Marmoricola sp.]